MGKDRRLLLIYTLVLIDVVVAAVITPVMPQFVKHHSHPELWLAGATALFLGLQLFSGPLLGKLADDLGRRPILILSTIGTLLANGLLIPIKTGLLLLNRVSLGNVLGPMLAGGVLTVMSIPTNQQTQAIVYVGIGLAALNVGVSLFSSKTSPESSGFDGPKLRQTVLDSINLKRLWQQLNQKEQQPGLRRLVLVRVALALTQGYYTYFVTYLALSPLRYDTRAISYFFIYYGGLSVFTSFVFYRYVADRLNQGQAIFWFSLLGIPVVAGYGVSDKSDSC